MPHYHVRWSNSTLDWEAFPTPEGARAQAEQLVRPGESYVIEQVDGDCPRCNSLLNRAERNAEPTQKADSLSAVGGRRKKVAGS